MEGPCVESVIRNCLGNLLLLSRWVRRPLPYVVCQFLICQKKVQGKNWDVLFFYFIFPTSSCVWHCRDKIGGREVSWGRVSRCYSLSGTTCWCGLKNISTCLASPLPPRSTVTEPIGCSPGTQNSCTSSLECIRTFSRVNPQRTEPLHPVPDPK